METTKIALKELNLSRTSATRWTTRQHARAGHQLHESPSVVSEDNKSLICLFLIGDDVNEIRVVKIGREQRKLISYVTEYLNRIEYNLKINFVI